MVKKVEALLQTYFPTEQDGQRIISFLEEAKDQYEQVKKKLVVILVWSTMCKDN